MTSLIAAVAPVSRVFTTRFTNLSEKLPLKHGVPTPTSGTSNCSTVRMTALMHVAERLLGAFPKCFLLLQTTRILPILGFVNYLYVTNLFCVLEVTHAHNTERCRAPPYGQGTQQKETNLPDWKHSVKSRLQADKLESTNRDSAQRDGTVGSDAEWSMAQSMAVYLSLQL